MCMRLKIFRPFLFVLCYAIALILIILLNQQRFRQPSILTPATLMGNETIVQLQKRLFITTENIFLANKRLWYFSDGSIFPNVSKGNVNVFPDGSNGDRIIEQLMYVPETYKAHHSPKKVILVYNGLEDWFKTGSLSFEECPVNQCSLTVDQSRAVDADAILYKDYQLFQPDIIRPSNQIWILYLLECPYRTEFVIYANVFNWTATYRRDSDLVAPYERWTYYDPLVTQKLQGRDYAANKTKKVAWFVSNCADQNGRLEYARELSKFIPVDIYGSCGSLNCPRTDPFENSNCKDYITEKLYVNALSHNVLPIVMGARPEDYEISAPYNSFIHVDNFSGPADLAAYLHLLDKDDQLYNSYFRWKGTGEFINTYFLCRLCALMHSPSTSRHYEDFNEWWRGSGTCNGSFWNSFDKRED